MKVTLEEVVGILRSNADALRARGILHAAVFGSVARGDARPDSDIDLLVDLEPDKPSGIFEYVRLQHDVAALFGRNVDLVERQALKPLIREEASRDLVNVF
ncbi:MAG TPA: nucleotidyltransferase family protein [Rhizomicrobium sp.]|nr:nucleotidyltransferase family protein [Rhizomicrobium sp.]